MSAAIMMTVVICKGVDGDESREIEIGGHNPTSPSPLLSLHDSFLFPLFLLLLPPLFPPASLFTAPPPAPPPIPPSLPPPQNRSSLLPHPSHPLSAPLSAYSFPSPPSGPTSTASTTASSLTTICFPHLLSSPPKSAREQLLSPPLGNYETETDEAGRCLGIAVYDPNFSWINHSCSPNSCFRFSVSRPNATSFGEDSSSSLRIVPSVSDDDSCVCICSDYMKGRSKKAINGVNELRRCTMSPSYVDHALEIEQLEHGDGKSHLNVKFHPFHHIALSAYTTLTSAYRIRSSDDLALHSRTDESQFKAFDMSRISAAYSVVGSQAERMNVKSISSDFLARVSNMAPKIWRFLIIGCHYLETIEDPFDFRWLALMNRDEEHGGFITERSNFEHQAELYNN
ncbi:hypothetical protein F3Y22_tig00110007pilonHSYRG00249 [Hibiscus syriacus]|uniref:SET domain-containing protein n=1 Tax=Hibiscus syriacus TaxID=106335 RepID=A0A6A3BRW0_HIBSY|nr:hypothetical protein F3Y22_tig00110007pilonHSYRG00249 [Hibiscus syriacus]